LPRIVNFSERISLSSMGSTSKEASRSNIVLSEAAESSSGFSKSEMSFSVLSLLFSESVLSFSESVLSFSESETSASESSTMLSVCSSESSMSLLLLSEPFDFLSESSISSSEVLELSVL
jgi:hypothetical protein